MSEMRRNRMLNLNHFQGKQLLAHKLSDVSQLRNSHTLLFTSDRTNQFYCNFYRFYCNLLSHIIVMFVIIFSLQWYLEFVAILDKLQTATSQRSIGECNKTCVVALLHIVGILCTETIDNAKHVRKKAERKWRKTKAADDLLDFKSKRNHVTHFDE